MDCQMPIMDGYKVTKIFKNMMQRNEIKKTPNNRFTATSGERDFERCKKCGMDDFLNKLLMKHDLLKLIAKLDSQNSDNYKPYL